MKLRRLVVYVQFIGLFTAGLGVYGPGPIRQLRAEDSRPVNLRYRFQTDQVVRYEVIMNDDYRIQVGEAVDHPYSHQKSRKSYRVKSVQEDGSAILELTIESVAIELFQNGEKHTFDTKPQEGRQKPEEPAFQALEDLVGKPHLQVTVSPQGVISQIRPLVQKDQVPEDPQQTAFDVLLQLPPDPIPVGGTWKEDFEISVALPNSKLRRPVKVQRQYTLQSVDNNLATIEMRTRILTVLDEPEEQLQLLRRTPQGTIVIDVQRGLLVSKSFTQNNEVTGFQNGPSIMSFKQQQREELVEVATAAVGSTTPR